MYDPAIGRFLSADPIIQAPYNSQSYNRYSYVWNNPLSNTDPSGFVANRDDDCQVDGRDCSHREAFEMEKCRRNGLDCSFKKDGQGRWRAVGTTTSLVTLATARAAGVIAGYVRPELNLENYGMGTQVSETAGDNLNGQEDDALTKGDVGDEQAGAQVIFNYKTDGLDKFEKANKVYGVDKLFATVLPEGMHKINISIDSSLPANTLMRTPNGTTILVNPNNLSTSSLNIVGSAIGHELVHINDFLRGNLSVFSNSGARASEARAYSWQLSNAQYFELSISYRSWLVQQIMTYR